MHNQRKYCTQQLSLFKRLFYLCHKFCWRNVNRHLSMKRESGANPGQSRCCELFLKIKPSPYATAEINGGKAVYQSKSEDLQDLSTFESSRTDTRGTFF